MLYITAISSQCEQMLLVFALALFVECRGRRRRHRFARNEDEALVQFRKSLKKVADDVARSESRSFHEKRNKRQISGIFKSAMMSKMGVPWKEIIAAVPELVDKTPSMFAPNVKHEPTNQAKEKWLKTQTD